MHPRSGGGAYLNLYRQFLPRLGRLLVLPWKLERLTAQNDARQFRAVKPDGVGTM